MLGERYMDTGQFGLSLSRCPRLETVDTYKFRCLGDCNYAVLPALQNLSLHRSECTTHLDILYAPKLTDVSLQAAYELRGFKLRNIPTATVATVEALLASKAEAAESARQAARAEDARWRDQSQQKALTKEARNRGWIERDEKWRVNPEPPAGIDDDADSDDMFFGGGGGGRSEYDVYEEILSEHCEEMFRKRVEPATKAAEAEHLGASVADASLPRCSIDVTNMSGFRLSSLEPQAMLGGMGGGGMGGMGGGGPEADMQRKAQANQSAAAEKNAGEVDSDTFKWEQTSKYGESEIIVRFPLETPATKKDVKVVFKARELKVTVAGVELMNGKTAGTITIDDSTWCLVEKGSELQLLLALAEDVKWKTLLQE